MWGRGRNKVNPGMVPTWGGSSSNKGMGSSSSLCITYGRTALGSGGGGRARVGPAGKGRRGAVHPRSEVVSSSCLHHGWARE